LYSSIAAAVLGLAINAAHAELIQIETVIVVGSRCPSGATCGTYSLDGTMQDTNDVWLYAPFTVLAVLSEAAAVQKFMDFLAKSKDACRRAGETQLQWLNRQIANFVAPSFTNNLLVPHINNAFLEKARNGTLNPVPPSCR